MVGLRALLCQEIEVCDDLLDLLDRERRAIVLSEVEELANVVADKERRAGELKKLESARLAALAPVASHRGFAPDQLRLSDLDSQLVAELGDSAGTPAELSRLAVELAAKIRLIDHGNRDNQVLLKDALEAVGMTLDILGGMRGSGHAYDRAGRSRRPARGSGAIDHRL